MSGRTGRRAGRRVLFSTLLTAATVAALGLAGGPSAGADPTRPPPTGAPGAARGAGPAAPGGGGTAQRPVRGEVRVDDADVSALAAATGRTTTAARELLVTQEARGKTGGRLVGELGETRTAGAYFDAAGQLVVTVLDTAGADRVRAAGVTARTVTRSTATLKGIQASFDPDRVAGTAWMIDPAANQVVLMLPQTTPPAAQAKTDRLLATARGHGAAVRVHRFAGQLGLNSDIAGGDRISVTDTKFCSAAFTVSNGFHNYVLTAGHCGVLYGWPRWRNWLNVDLGPTVDAWFPTWDDALVRIDGPVWPHGAIWLYNGILRSVYGGAWSVTGQSVCKSGQTTKVTCGNVTGVNATVNFAQGTVHGLDATNLCSKGGDSGGALFAGNTALAILSGGNFCPGGASNAGNHAFFMPVIPDLDYWGVWLIGGP